MKTSSREQTTTRRSALDDPPAIVLGGTVTALSVSRSLWEAGVRVHVLDRPDSPARFSRQRDSFVDVGGPDMQDRMLAWLDTAPEGAVVLAGSDDGLELIARHGAELASRGLRPMESDGEVLLAMLDKQRSYEIAEAHGIGTPKTICLRTPADVEKVADELSYPCLLKPNHAHLFRLRAKSDAKVLTIGSPDELRVEFERLQDVGVEMLVTEVICGPSDEFVSYFGYVDEQGTPLVRFTKRKMRQYPPGFGLGTYHGSTHDPEVAELGQRFLDAAGLRGLGNVEFKRDGRDGQLKVIECNARFTASNEVIRRAGVDLPLFAYNRLVGRPTPPVDPYRDDVRLWEPVNDTRAFLVYRRRGELTLHGWLRSIAHHQYFPVAKLSDPLPVIVRHAEKLTRATGRRESGAAPPSTGPSGVGAVSAVSAPARPAAPDAAP